MKFQYFLILCATAFTSLAKADDLSRERVQALNDVIVQSLQCEVASGLLKVSMASERELLLKVISSAATELGLAMLDGQIADSEPTSGRRCLAHFNLAPRPGMNSADALFLIGFEIGQVRSCFNELFVREMYEAIPTGPLLGGNSALEVDDRNRAQEFARARFDELGCQELISGP